MSFFCYSATTSFRNKANINVGAFRQRVFEYMA